MVSNTWSARTLCTACDASEIFEYSKISNDDCILMFQIAFMFTELIKNKNFDINIYTEYEHNFLI